MGFWSERIPAPLRALVRPAWGKLIARPSVQDYLLHVVYLARFRAWRAAQACPLLDMSPGVRFELYEHVVASEGLEGPLTYLEFGVMRGESLRWWVARNQDPQARFVGFDWFQGLPADWGAVPKGTYTTEGEVPQIDDPRVSFEVGLFRDTLPGFLAGFTRQGPLVVHLDADLYGSTLFALTHLAPHLQPGDVLIFDEFSDDLHEFRAFVDAGEGCPLRCEAIAASRYWIHAALRVVEVPRPLP